MELFSLESINAEVTRNQKLVVLEEKAEAAQRERNRLIMEERAACGCDLCQCGLPHGTDPEWI